MSTNEIMWICFGVVAFWNVVLTITLYFNSTDHARLDARIGNLLHDVKGNHAKVTSFSKELMGHLGVKLITWKEAKLVSTGEWFGPVCREIPRYAIVSVGIAPEEIELMKNPPEED